MRHLAEATRDVDTLQFRAQSLGVEKQRIPREEAMIVTRRRHRDGGNNAATLGSTWYFVNLRPSST
jgi:hypothetical protein